MTPSQLIDREIARHRDWRGKTMAQVRDVIRDTVPDVTEEWKWMGTPTWSRDGIVCICNAFKEMVKVTFYNGAKLGLDACSTPSSAATSGAPSSTSRATR